RRTRGRGDEGVLEHHTLTPDAVERRRIDDVVHPRAPRVAVDAGIAAPIIREAEQDVEPLRGGGRRGGGQGQGTEGASRHDTQPFDERLLASASNQLSW